MIKLLITLSLFASLPAQAIIITATEDAMVRGGSYANNNAPSIVAVKNSGLDTARKSYIKFNYGTPYDFGDATLSLTLYDTYALTDISISVYGLTDEAIEGWSKSTITWNNAPANDISSNLFLSSAASFLGTFNVPFSSSPNSLFHFTSSDFMDFLNADSNGSVTLMLAAQTSMLGGGVVQFHSRESQYSPTIEGSPTAVVPIPASAMLMVSGLLALVGVGLCQRKSDSLALAGGQTMIA